MATPNYFRYFPNIEYPVKLSKSGKTESITIKDYFHLLLPRDDIFKEETLYEQYFVQNDGTISTTADSPSVLAGTAISATELLVKT